jgi:hypothetical protein
MGGNSRQRPNNRLRGQPSGGRTGSNKVTKQEVHAIVRGTLAADQETKFTVITQNSTFTLAGSYATPLTEVPQGLLDTNRVGDTISLIDIWARLNILCGDTTNFVRIVMVQWKGPIVAATALDTPDILLNQGVNANNVVAPYNQDNIDAGILKILYDETIGMTTAGSTAALVRDIRLRNGFVRKLQYVAGTQTGYNKISLHFFSDSAAAPNPSVYGNVMIRFSDA